VRVTPDGVKTFALLYRAGRGRKAARRRVTLGRYGALTVDAARCLAGQVLAEVAKGGDPAQDRSHLKTAPTVAELGELYLADVTMRRKQTTAREYARLWSRHVLPAFGNRKVSSVTTADIRRLHRSLSSTPFIANRVAALLGAFFTFAAQEGVGRANENPAHDVEFYLEEPRERFLAPAEFVRLGEALRTAERVGLPPAPHHRRKPKSAHTIKHRAKDWGKPKPADPFAVAAIRLLALTGCRESEILSLQWDCVDFDHGYLRLADSKTGKSNRAIGASVASLLHSLPRLDDSVYVLPGSKPGTHLKEIKRLWHSIRHAAGLGNLRLHDLRHSFASVPASGGESMLVLRSLLGHARVATTERYAHLSDDPLRRAADKASREIASWLDGSDTAIVPLRNVR
jgi:integrase